MMSRTWWKLLLTAMVATMLLASCGGGGGGQGQGGGGGDKTFALVPKSTDIPVFAEAGEACKQAAKEIGATCDYVGPSTPDEAEQIQVLRDVINSQPDGISVSALNPDAVAPVIDQAVQQGIEVVTFDADAPDSQRQAYIGTNNTKVGQEEARLLKEALPDGGQYAVITGAPGAANLNERIDALRDNLGPEFEEVQGSPYPCDDDTTKAVQITGDILTRYPDIDAIVSPGGWPLFAPEAYKNALGEKQAERVRSGELAIIMVDTLKEELDLMEDGVVTALVGQRFTEMGELSAKTLNDLAEGKKLESDTINSGLDIVTQENLKEFRQRAGK